MVAQNKGGGRWLPERGEIRAFNPELQPEHADPALQCLPIQIS